MSAAWIAALAGTIWVVGIVLVVGLGMSAKRGDSTAHDPDPLEARDPDPLEPPSPDPLHALSAEAAARLPARSDAPPPRQEREPLTRVFACARCGAQTRRPTVCRVCLSTEFATARISPERSATEIT